MKYILLIISILLLFFYFKNNDDFLDGESIHIRGIGNYKYSSIIKLKRILNKCYDKPVIIDSPLKGYYEYGNLQGQKCIDKYDSNDNTILITNDKLYSDISGKRVAGLAEYLGNIIIVIDDDYLNLKRVIVHEVGHTQGLNHCDNNHCYMSCNRHDNEIFYLCKKCINIKKLLFLF
jgi:hypothetical protein